MWGNKQGWFISAIIAAIMGYMLWSLGTVESISPPSGEYPHLLSAIQLPVSPSDTISNFMKEDRDAGDLYWQAIEARQAFPTGYNTFDASKIKSVGDLPAIRLILEAAPAKRATLFAKRPELLVNYRYPWAELDAITGLGQIVNSAGHYYAISRTNRNADQALKFLTAGFSLGSKLFDERVTHAEMLNGIKLMQGSADSMRALADAQGDKTRSAALKRFSDETSAYYSTQIQKLYQKIAGQARTDISTNAGDVFELAQKSPDRMWRVESLLKVGRYKYNATRRGDQIGAMRMASDDPARYGFVDWSKADDAAVREAGKAARDLTLEQFRTIQ